MTERGVFHIGVDGRVLAERHTGVAVYTRLLLRFLLRCREDFRLTLFTHRSIEPSTLAELGGAARISSVVLTCSSAMVARPVWDHILLPIRASRMDLNLFFSPLTVVPRFLKVPRIVTLHDLGFLRYPEIQPAKYRWYWEAALRRAGRKAAALIAVSESTRRDAVDLLGAVPERITVIPEAVDPFFQQEPPVGEEEQILQSLGLKPGYLLTVGTLEPRKNYRTILDVLDRLRVTRPDLRLVIAGMPGWLCDKIVRRIRRRSDCIRWIQDADDIVLRTLYRNAAVFLFPSLYEGFGLPVLEAMACGVPVVTSNAGSLPEVAGDAVVCLPPQDAEAISEWVFRLLENENLRLEYRARGYSRVRLFSWEQTALRTWELFERYLKSPPLSPAERRDEGT